MTTAEVNYRVKADASGMTTEMAKAERSVRDVDKATDKAGKSADQFGKKAKSVRGMATAFKAVGAAIAGLGIARGLQTLITNTARQDAALAQLNATLKSTEGAAGKTADELTRTAAELQKVTRYGDEAIIEMQSLLLTFKDIKGDNFDRTTQSVLDMATAMKMDLKSAALQLGKALNDPAKNLSNLSRAGVTFTEDQMEMVKAMQAAGDMAGAQTLILKELESQFGGSAKAARETLGGALDGLSNAWGDLFEAESKTSGSMIENLGDLEKLISSPQFKEAMASLLAGLSKIITLALEGSAAIIKLSDSLGKKLARVVGGIATDDVPELEKRIKFLNETLADMASMGQTTGSTVEGLREELAELEEKLRIARDLGLDQAGATQVMGSAAEAAGESIAQLEEIVVTATRRNTEFTDSLEQETQTLGELEEIVVSAKRWNSDLADGTKDLAKTTEDATEGMGIAWSDYQATMSGFFNDFLTNGKDAFGNLLNSFKKMLSDMVAEMVTSGIMKMFASGFSGGFSGLASNFVSGAASTQGGSILSSVFGGSGSGGGGLSSLLGGSGGSSLSAIGPYLGFAAGAYGVSQHYSDIQDGKYQWGDVLSGSWFRKGGMEDKFNNFLPGFGSYFGKPTAEFFPNGGLNPILDALDIDPIQETLFNGLFSGNGNNRVYADIRDGIVGSPYNTDSGSHSAQRKAVEAVSEPLQAFIELLGGTSLDTRFSVSAKHGFESSLLGGDGRTKDPENFLEKMFRAIIEGAEHLDPALRKMLAGFRGTTEEIADFTHAVLTLDGLTNINAVSAAFTDFSRELPTVQEGVQNNVASLQDLINSHDGSTSSLHAITVAYRTSQEEAYNFAMSVLATRDALKSAGEEQSSYFRNAVLDPKELRFQRAVERDMLRENLGNLTDAGEIETATRRILELNRLIFDSLSPEAQARQAGAFSTVAERVTDQAGRLLGRELGNLEGEQEGIANQINILLGKITPEQQAAADTQNTAANTQNEASLRNDAAVTRMEGLVDRIADIVLGAGGAEIEA